MNIAPKERFQKDKEAFAFHLRVTPTDEFHYALETALCEMELGMPPVVNPAQDVTTASQMAGARRFISILLNLSTPSKPLPSKDPTAINYNA